MRRVLITGATGFIGRHLLARLAGGCEVVAAVRRAVELNDAKRVVPVGDFRRDTAWDEALEGVDAVIHLGGTVHQRDKTMSAIEAFRVPNVEGTIALAAASARHGVRDFIFMSSIAVNGSSTDGRSPFTEADPPQTLDAYSLSKHEAEVGLRALAARTGMALTIIRPPLVYGIGASGSIAMLRRAFARGMPLPLASIRNRRAFVSVGNLADFVAWRLARTNSGTETFIVADEGYLSTPEFVAALADSLGMSPRLVAVPAGLLAMGVRWAGRGALVPSLMASLEVDMSAALAAGWRPSCDTRTGIRREFSPDGVRAA